MKLQIQYDDAVLNAKNDQIRSKREESKQAITDAIFLISELQTDIEHLAVREHKLRAEIKSLEKVMNQMVNK